MIHIPANTETPATVAVAGILLGTLGGTRTPDPLLRRQMLYPAELQAHIISCLKNKPTAIIQRA